MGSYQKSKGRSNKSPPFVKIEHKMLEHPNYLKLTPYGAKLLVEFIYQYRGSNNGDLCAAYSILKKRGWRSSATLQRAINELLYYKFILLTRQGGRNSANLYALGWLPIDECNNKLDVSATKSGSRDWSLEKPLFDCKKVDKKIGFCTPYMNQPAPYMNLSSVK